MKALIQFELDSKLLNDEQLKDKLVETMVELCAEWVKGDAVLYIDFIKTNLNENNKHNRIDNRNTN
jgi:predicted RNase H-like nuclease